MSNIFILKKVQKKKQNIPKYFVNEQYKVKWEGIGRESSF